MIFKKIFKISFIYLILFFSFFNPVTADNATPEPVCAVYITGIGCGNCAVTDPRLLTDTINATPGLIVFEYEIYRQRKDNQEVKSDYFKNYLKNNRPGVPFFLLSKEKTYMGKFRVMQAAEEVLNITVNKFPMILGTIKERIN